MFQLRPQKDFASAVGRERLLTLEVMKRQSRSRVSECADSASAESPGCESSPDAASARNAETNKLKTGTRVDNISALVHAPLCVGSFDA